MAKYEEFVDYVYGILKLDCEDLDAIYKDHIIHMIGVYGFNALHVKHLIESCGSVNGRELYVLCSPTKLDNSALQTNKK